MIFNKHLTKNSCKFLDHKPVLMLPDKDKTE